MVDAVAIRQAITISGYFAAGFAAGALTTALVIRR